MVNMTVQEMFDVGAHFGHQTKKWNPKMKPYIFTSRSGIHILDLQKTQTLAQKALTFIEELVASGKNMLFVGTKKQAKDVIQAEAARASMPYITQRWLGGSLTNFGTIKRNIDRLHELESRREKNDFAGFTKKELLIVDREIEKLNETFGGLRNMRGLPGGIFVVDPSIEKIAVHEANILRIPVIAVVDSNCNPDPIDFPVPANDDAIRSIQLFVSRIADACLAGLEKRDAIAKAEEAKDSAESKKRQVRKAKDVSGAGKAYVSKADNFEAGVESFSANVTESAEPKAAAVVN